MTRVMEAILAARQQYLEGKLFQAKSELESVEEIGDVKVEHSLAVLNFLVSGKQNHKELDSQLAALIKKLADFARCCEVLHQLYTICTEQVTFRRCETSAPDFSHGLFPICGSTTSTSSEAAGDDHATSMHAFRIHQFLARIALASRNFRNCKVALKETLNLKKQDVVSLFLKSSQEFLRGNYTKSIKLLTSSPKPVPVQGGQHLGVMFYNNMGIVQLKLNKLGLASAYLRNALQMNTNYCVHRAPTGNDTSTNKSNNDQRTTHPLHDRNDEVLYNFSLAQIKLRHFTSAFSTLERLTPTFAHTPMYWLRLAECCNEARGTPPRLFMTVGDGIHRKAQLVSSERNWKNIRPSMSLVQAIHYLDCALDLIHHLRHTSQPQISPANSPGTLQRAFQTIELDHAGAHAYTLSAYVYLQLGSSVMALHSADCALAFDDLDSVLHYHATIYRNSALIIQGRYESALDGLDPDSLSFQPPSTAPETIDDDADGQDAGTTSQYDTSVTSSEAKASMYLCRAEAQRCLNQLKNAQNSLHQASQLLQDSNNTQLYLGAMIENVQLSYTNEEFKNTRIIFTSVRVCNILFSDFTATWLGA
eukprot:gene683-3983_t